ncbi:ParA family protein [Paracoccus sp. R12_1]|jgi:chromosome partitioning protein|uniref:ParA family protein n=1 Tax=unclassified Paracoccus (in: a-proteobacteria) TaxID=2688777 RepID=UPI001ADBB72E|nr:MULTISPECIES: AAA family ATPase [unclassified Paracoccus (in: a-proteobacteria)]MBO9454003.1 ParA family protein [Paracoccus sp. R12_2]MBO9485650.1 ParA family protein [Paracoccus sp. R12_1]
MSDHNIVAIANQKGGVGKTTTAINLGAALADAGYETVLIDLDPQGNASTGLGILPEQRERTIYDLLAGPETLQDCAVPTQIPNLRIVPATSDLSSADVDLSQTADRTRLLRRKLESLPQGSIVLIDCPPALGLLTVNAMVAADSVLVPLQAEFYALEGLSQLLTTVKQVRRTANPELRINGVLLTMSDYRNNLSQQVEADARATLADLVYPTVIPRNVRVSEAPSHAQPVLIYDPSSKGSAAYRAFAAEFAARLKLVPEEA